MSNKKDAAKQKNAGGLRKRFRVAWAELKKVHWPNREETVKYTGVVLTTVALVTVMIWLVDSGITALFSLFA